MFCTYDWFPSSDINEVTPVENFDPFLNMVMSSVEQLTESDKTTSIYNVSTRVLSKK